MAQQLPDLVLADLQMPQMNGLELVTAIKNDFPFVPVILMTGQGSEDIAAQALRQGAASYVTKKKLAVDLMPTVLRILLGASEDRAHSQLMHYLEGSEEVFLLSNDLNLIKALVTHLQQRLRCLPLRDETDRLRVGVALEEALLNAFYHGNLEIGTVQNKADRLEHEKLVQQRLGESPYRERQIRVTARLSRAEAIFTIRDEGPGFDVSGLPQEEFPDEEKVVGRGVTLMRMVMDQVTYNEAGNEVTLIKRCAQLP
jgi:CheY-like chemotaxis protein